ncbi:MAG: PEP-CTERM sorting domain-containing protein [Rubrivivax sp.]|nr:PEP-CTERM sorting domain-containing protein [Rubrivivax sp.]
MSFKSVTAAASLLAALAAAPAQAGVIFSDNFDADSAASVLNFNGLINWTVSGGTIDYIRSGGFGISCVGGTGGCLDMDGSAGNAGRITTRQVFDFDDGVEYTFEMMLSGNQRGGASDTVTYGLISVDTGFESTLSAGPLAPNAPFATFGGSLLGQNFAGNWRFFIEGAGGDNIGAILDNVVLRDNRTANVPEPATLLLSGLALLAAGAVRRRGR